MEFTKNQIKITKGIAILFMLLLHLFCTKDFDNLYKPIIMIGNIPLVYYLALFGDCCVAIYCFCSGYGLLVSYEKTKENYFKNNIKRLLKLYINFWIILFMFVVVLGSIMGMSDNFPGDFKTFLLTFTALSPDYNGAWWFLTTYIFLVLLSPLLNRIVIKFNIKFVLIVSFLFYFVAYIQRIKGVITFDNSILDWVIRQISLFGTSQLPFIVGAMFAYKRWYSKLYNKFNHIKYKNILGITLIVMMIIGHSFVETLFIAVFTGIVFICIFNLLDKPKWLNKLLDYLGEHSTNMWLTHMFLYMIYFKELVYAPKYSPLIFIWLIILCLGASYLVNFIYKPIIKLVDKKYIENINFNSKGLEN